MMSEYGLKPQARPRKIPLSHVALRLRLLQLPRAGPGPAQAYTSAISSCQASQVRFFKLK